MDSTTWKYRATVIRVVDGDTILVDIDMGMNVWSKGQYVRFAHINAPELKTQAGKDAKAYLEGQLKPGDLLQLETLLYREHEKYGRVLAIVSKGDASINQLMLDSGNAVPYE